MGTSGSFHCVNVIQGWDGRCGSWSGVVAHLLSQLLGDDETAIGGVRCYIGEAEDVATRLRQHNSEKSGKHFWERVVVITSKDENLTKGALRT